MYMCLEYFRIATVNHSPPSPLACFVRHLLQLLTSLVLQSVNCSVPQGTTLPVIEMSGESALEDDDWVGTGVCLEFWGCWKFSLLVVTRATIVWCWVTVNACVCHPESLLCVRHHFSMDLSTFICEARFSFSFTFYWEFLSVSFSIIDFNPFTGAKPLTT